MMDDALALLESTPLESLVSGVQDVVLLEHSASVADALKVCGCKYGISGSCFIAWRCIHLAQLLTMPLCTLLQTLAACNILSAPLVVNPGLEDVETLSPAEASPQLLGVCERCTRWHWHPPVQYALVLQPPPLPLPPCLSHA